MLKIGLSAGFFHPDPKRDLFKGKTLQYSEQSILHWVMSHESRGKPAALAVVIPSPEGDTRRGRVTAADYARELDGLVLQGGADVCPASYDEVPMKPEWNGDRIRDLYEIGLLNAFMAAGKPVLGICRGAQIINVAFGGTLYQDIGAGFHAGMSTAAATRSIQCTIRRSKTLATDWRSRRVRNPMA